MDIGNKIDVIFRDLDDTINEDRPAYPIDFVRAISETPFVEKMVSAYSTIDGAAGLFRGVDGNAYEVIVRPAKHGKFEPFKKHTKQP